MTRPSDPIALAERILTLLEIGSFSATYKYALLLAILDLCIERTSQKGEPPDVLTTRQLAEKVTELYWPHATPYDGGAVLRQGGVRAEHQAEILSAISNFRARHAGSPGEVHHRARLLEPDRFERLLRAVEWKLIEMPIPRLQVVGGDEDRFLYEYHWTVPVRRSDVSAYQRGRANAFDNRILLRPGIAESLIALNGVLRPVIRREWTLMVADMNSLPEQKLETFLFGASRVALDLVRGPLRHLQAGRCFYCADRIDARADVDHFIPWSRYPENALDNLVVAHDRCNNRKRDFFAALPHVQHWAARNSARGGELAAIAAEVRWPRDPARTGAVARAMYTRLPSGARLWLSGDEFVPIDHRGISDALRDVARG